MILERVYSQFDDVPENLKENSALAWAMGPILQEWGFKNAFSLSGIERAIKQLTCEEKKVLLGGAIKVLKVIQKVVHARRGVGLLKVKN